MKDYLPMYLKSHAKDEIIVVEKDGGFELSFQFAEKDNTDFFVYKTKNNVSNNYLNYVKQMEALYKKYKFYNKNGCSLGSMSTPDGKIVLGYSKGMDFITLEDITDLEKQLLNDIDAIIIKVLSIKTSFEYEVFNSCKNGYDAMITHSKCPDTEHKFLKSKCRKCGNDIFELFITIHSTGYNDLLINHPCKEITEDNWTNAFDWFVINRRCSHCGHTIKKWFEIETM